MFTVSMYSDLGFGFGFWVRGGLEGAGSLVGIFGVGWRREDEGRWEFG